MSEGTQEQIIDRVGEFRWTDDGRFERVVRSPGEIKPVDQEIANTHHDPAVQEAERLKQKEIKELGTHVLELMTKGEVPAPHKLSEDHEEGGGTANSDRSQDAAYQRGKERFEKTIKEQRERDRAFAEGDTGEYPAITQQDIEEHEKKKKQELAPVDQLLKASDLKEFYDICGVLSEKGITIEIGGKVFAADQLKREVIEIAQLVNANKIMGASRLMKELIPSGPVRKQIEHLVGGDGIMDLLIDAYT